MDTTLTTATHDVTPMVCVLGPVQVIGAARPLRRASSLDLVCYLAFHRNGATTDQWVTALWPDRLMAPATIYSTASAARRCLGVDQRGEDYLPQRHLRLELSSSVRTDVDVLNAALRHDDLSCLVRATSLVRGRPFDGLRGGDWAVLEGHVAAAEEVIAAVGCRLVPELIDRGESECAAKVTRTLLGAAPFDERLWRLLFDVTYAQGRRVGLDHVLAEMAVTFGAQGVRCGTHPVDLLEAFVHPQTVNHYRRLRHGVPEKVEVG